MALREDPTKQPTSHEAADAAGQGRHDGPEIARPLVHQSDLLGETPKKPTKKKKKKKPPLGAHLHHTVQVRHRERLVALVLAHRLRVAGNLLVRRRDDEIGAAGRRDDDIAFISSVGEPAIP